MLTWAMLSDSFPRLSSIITLRSRPTTVAFSRLSDEEIAEGWVLRGDIAYSPRISTVAGLRFQRDGLDSPGYDEWYIFTEPPPALGSIYHGNYFDFQPGPGHVMVFVNDPAFLLHEPNPYLPGILERFWNQMQELQATTFIADGQDCVTLVSTDHALIQTAADRLIRTTPERQPPPSAK